MDLFTLETSRPLASKIAAHLQIPLGRHEERDFEDSEFKVRPLEDVRGHAVFVCQSLYADAGQSANDKLCRLLFFIGALKDAGARKVDAVVPYLAYARKDRRTKPRDPVTLRYVAALFEAVGTDGILVMEVHNVAAFDNAFRCVKEHLEAAPLFVEHFIGCIAPVERVVVLSPDAGGVKRAVRFADLFASRWGRPVALAFMEKQRSGGRLSGEAFAGDVEDAVVIIVDDLISSGATLARAARACVARGAREIHAAAAHAVFSERTEAALNVP